MMARWRSFGKIVGWTCSLIVSFEALLGSYTILDFKFHTVPKRFRQYSGPNPWFSKGFSLGTGFFINASGDIITNEHVVRGCKRVTVAGPGIDAAYATVLLKNEDMYKDLALININHKTSIWLAFKSQPLPINIFPDVVGNLPISIVGFPYDLDGSLAKSVLATGLTPISSDGQNNHWLISINAQLQGGNSGSPVLDGEGNVIGVVSKSSMPSLWSNDSKLIVAKGYEIYGGYITDWLNRNHVLFTINKEGMPRNANITNAVVRVFCFGRS